MLRRVLVAIVAACLSTTCRGAERPAATAEQLAALRQSRTQYDSLGGQFRQALKSVGEPLKRLTPEQQASVAALVLMTRVATEQQFARGKLLQGLWTDIPEFCPPLRSVSFSRGGCLDAEIAYASAMAKCEADGKSEDACEQQAAPEAAAAVSCWMREIQALAGIIHQIPGRAWPPGPFPWPIQPEATPHGLPSQ
jgi:hypothetical protein